jgi:hypothetical protein
MGSPVLAVREGIGLQTEQKHLNLGQGSLYCVKPTGFQIESNLSCTKAYP